MYEFAFELPDGRWLHKATEVFGDNEGRARDWAERATALGEGVVTFKGKFPAPRYVEGGPGSAYWCETFGDNRWDY